MNSIAHISACVALLWLSVDFTMSTLGEVELGYGILGIFFLFVVLTFQAVFDDLGGVVDRVRKRG